MKRQDMEHLLSMQFRRTDQMLRRAMERSLKRTGLFIGQHRILMHLNKCPNCSQVELAEQLEISPAAVAVSIKKLEKNGYIQRKPDVTDNRALQVLVTQKGQRVVEQSISIFREVESDMFEGFSDEEMKRFFNDLERVYQNLAKIKNGGNQTQ